MKLIKIKNQDNKFIHSKFNFKSLGAYLIYSKNFKILLFILLIFIIIISNDIILIVFIKKNSDIIFNIKNEEANNIPLIKSNINLSDEFFQIPEVREQIYNNKLSYVKTLSGGHSMIGNALICLNKLLSICVYIGCQNIIVPKGLQRIIKNPIIYKEKNIMILPETYKKKIKIDIELKSATIFYFQYKNKNFENRLPVLRNEVLRNIPDVHIKSNDLYIHIRSGDIFLNSINPNYAQPPLCFYQKIIIENNYNNIYIFSNGLENPVIGNLLKLYSKILYIKTSVEYAISLIIYAYNFIMSTSTFSSTLIQLNINLKNLYIYSNHNLRIKNINYTLHKMIPSKMYQQKVIGKWKKTQEQLNLMINEKCIKSKMITFSYNTTT